MNDLSRRDFLRTTGLTGLALWMGLSAKGTPVKLTSVSGTGNFTPYILVEPSGITIFNIKPEMGQGTFQSVPALIADEFEVSLDQVTIKNSNGEKELGPAQRAGGSASIRTGYTNFRKIGASAKAVFITAAATKWGVDPSTCYAEYGKVIHTPSKRSLAYTELIEEAARVPIPQEPKLKDPKDFKIVGKNIRRPDVPMKTNGTAEFGIDASVPGMVYASVERCPVIGGTLKSFDAAETLKVPGVQKVLAVDREIGKYNYTGVAVIANSYWSAKQGRDKLKITWDTKGYETFSSEGYHKTLHELAKQDGQIDKNIGSADTLNLSPENTIEAFYETPMVAHSPMEPMCCLAQVKDGKLEVWASTQVPSSVTGTGANDLAKHVNIPAENIKLNAKFIGGAFGRKLYLDYIIECVNLAKQLDKPVKLVWTREDTTKQGPFRPMTYSKLKGGFDSSGKLVLLEHKVISPSISEATRPNFDPTKVDGTMVEGIAEQAYEIPNIKTSYVRADFHIPVAAWRSVTSSTLAFAHECFIDELAYKAKQDPLAFRLSLLNKPSDTKKVLEKLREVSGWDKPLPKNKGRGVAQWEFFAGLGGHVVEVTYNADRTIKIDKVYVVIDLGEVVSPDNVKNQVEGCIAMAITAATKPAITFKMGQVEQSNFYDNILLRINEMPPVETHIIADGGKVKGVGEPGLPPFAPALANAIFAATGQRIRTMPFSLKLA